MEQCERRSRVTGVTSAQATNYSNIPCQVLLFTCSSGHPGPVLTWRQNWSIRNALQPDSIHLIEDVAWGILFRLDMHTRVRYNAPRLVPYRQTEVVDDAIYVWRLYPGHTAV